MLLRRWHNVAVWILKIQNISSADGGHYQCQVLGNDNGNGGLSSNIHPLGENIIHFQTFQTLH